ncbi:MAG TPA: hypothetical protein IAA54_02800 [Candidatus Gallacutalibacter pullicola]|uniref:DUF2383 domain-containing protein n=1 Tax=Candidatus Gallacutalibacter pullicola TaxID=2840830 RepID=A0A9D1J0G3_9FIRM|nr:hypothetical protein [Candidatus Gallacutalibacter pullicola]
MEQNQNQDLLEEVYRATQMGLEGIRAVTPKIEDTQLKKEIRREEAVYQKFVSRAEEMLAAKGAIPQTHDGVKKAMLWGSVQMNTLMDSSPEHMAELLINGTTMGIVDMTKKISELGDSDAGARRLAEDFINFEEKSVEQLKKYL